MAATPRASRSLAPRAETRARRSARDSSTLVNVAITPNDDGCEIGVALDQRADGELEPLLCQTSHRHQAVRQALELGFEVSMRRLTGKHVRDEQPECHQRPAVAVSVQRAGRYAGIS